MGGRTQDIALRTTVCPRHDGAPTDTTGVECMDQEQLMVLCLITSDQKRSFYDTL